MHHDVGSHAPKQRTEGSAILHAHPVRRALICKVNLKGVEAGEGAVQSEVAPCRECDEQMLPQVAGRASHEHDLTRHADCRRAHACAEIRRVARCEREDFHVEAGHMSMHQAAAREDTEGITQIPAEALRADCADLDALLGPWFHADAELDALSARFAASGAVPHVVIDGFLSEEAASELRAAFPPSDAPLWHVYDNPLEKKRACSHTARMPPCLRKALCALCGPTVVETVRRITRVARHEELQADPYCHGGGLHSHGVGDKLDLHLDYSRHPLTGLERRYNLILYLTHEWDETYGGALELWAAGADPAVPGVLQSALLPRFNRAVLFSTTAPSFHGFPAPLACPPDARRNSLALYYLTPPRPGAPERRKARYVATPGEPHDPELERLRTLREQRRLEHSDVVASTPKTTKRRRSDTTLDSEERDPDR